MNERIQKRRSTDNTAIVTVLRELEGQVNCLQTMQETYDHVTHRFMQDLEKLSSSVALVTQKYHEINPVAYEELRKFQDDSKENIKQMELQIQNLVLSLQRLKEDQVKLETVQTGTTAQCATKREQFLLIEATISRLQTDFQEFKTNIKAEVNVLGNSQKETTDRTKETAAALKAFKTMLLFIGGLAAFVATIVGTYQSLFVK